MMENNELPKNISRGQINCWCFRIYYRISGSAFCTSGDPIGAVNSLENYAFRLADGRCS